MEKVLTGLQWEILLVYLDDVIVFGRTVEEELERLHKVFGRLRSAGLKLKPSKCNLFQKSVTYLGHIVSAEGVATDPAKVKAVADWPVPKNVKEVRSFLGLASYYRRFIKDFASIASPLHTLTSKSKEFIWDESCDRAFNTLKQCVLGAPVLAYPLPGNEYILDTDASADGIGAVLSQVHEGEEKVVAFASRKLSKPEKNYCVTRRELLAVVTYLKYFRQYLYGQKVRTRTDHSSLTWLRNSKNPGGQLARWLEVVSEYDVTIQHRPGSKHKNADSLSRRPCNQCSHCDAQDNDGDDRDVVPGGSVAVDDMIDEETTSDPAIGKEVRVAKVQPSIGNNELRHAQMVDKSLEWLLAAKREGKERPQWEEIAHRSPASKTYWSYWDQLVMRDGLLYQRWSVGGCWLLRFSDTRR